MSTNLGKLGPISQPQIPFGSLSVSEVNLESSILGDAINQLLHDVRISAPVILDDLQVYKSPKGAVPTTVSQALHNGTKFFDAAYYLSLSNVEGIKLLDYDNDNRCGEENAVSQRKHAMILAIWCLLRGSYPHGQAVQPGTDVPAFIQNILGYRGTGTELTELLCSFDIMKIPLDWLKSVAWNRLPIEVRQRLSLGMAGFRLFTPFKILTPRNNISEQAKKAHDIVLALIRSGPTWDLFPPTRSAVVAARFGSLNKALESLMVNVFEDSDLAKITGGDLKVLFRKPVDDLRFQGWMSWKEEDVPRDMVPVFIGN